MIRFLQPEMLDRFYSRFPHTKTLRIVPIRTNDGYTELFDIRDVQGLLGPARWAAFSPTLKVVYSCGHDNYPVNHPDPKIAGTEVHAIAAADLEKFLAGGN